MDTGSMQTKNRLTFRASLAKVSALAAIAGISFATGACSGSNDEPATSTPTRNADASRTPSVSATASTPAALSDAELASLFTSVQFIPDQYDQPEEMLNSIYPGLTIAQPNCLSALGVGLTVDGASTEFGTSNDRTLTAAVVSIGDEGQATKVFNNLSANVDACTTEDLGLSVQGMKVEDATLTREDASVGGVDGVDESLGWRLTGTVAGQPTTVLGQAARVGGNLVVVAGWDPRTNVSNVPLAAENFAMEL